MTAQKQDPHSCRQIQATSHRVELILVYKMYKYRLLFQEMLVSLSRHEHLCLTWLTENCMEQGSGEFNDSAVGKNSSLFMN
jgi:hypothetical protein